MSNVSLETSPKSKRVADKKARDRPKTRAPRPTKLAAAMASAPPKSNESEGEGRVTKQERMLTLLCRPEGASIEEMMQATDWQQHSVRGFLAGTVRKKLGFTLSSSKSIGDVRRYRIEIRRGR
jgi:hypothetical protein